MVSITADVAVAASSASTDSVGAAAAPAATAAASTLARRIDIGLAVSRALDATLIQLARELRRGLGSTGSGRGTGMRGSRQQQQQQQQQPPSVAIARAAGAGLFLDAYEAAVTFLLQAFSCLAEGDPEQQQQQQQQQERRKSSLPLSTSSSSSSSSLSRNRGDPLRPNQPPEVSCHAWNRARAQPTSTPQTTTFARRAPEGGVVERERGVLPRGWDAGARGNGWTQRKLEVLGKSAGGGRVLLLFVARQGKSRAGVSRCFWIDAHACLQRVASRVDYCCL